MTIAMVTGPSHLPAERLFRPQDGPFSLELVIVTIQPLASESIPGAFCKPPDLNYRIDFFKQLLTNKK